MVGVGPEREGAAGAEDAGYRGPECGGGEPVCCLLIGIPGQLRLSRKGKRGICTVFC